MLSFTKNGKCIRFILGFLVSLNILIWIVVYNLSQPSHLKVFFFDVGQGDSIFIETPKRCQVLIDGGPDLTVLEKLSKEMPFYDKTIDLVILSHPEKDHLFGLLEVLKRYKVKNILWTGVINDTAEYREWEKLIEKEKDLSNAQIKIARSGQRIILEKDPLILIDILYPFDNLEGKKFKEVNDTSIVANLVFKDHSILFTGDISEKIEKKLIQESKLEKEDILKVAHHGSKTSTSEDFLEKIFPSIAVIQVGENKYGHPHPEVLARLKKFGIEILITKELGDIKFFFN